MKIATAPTVLAVRAPVRAGGRPWTRAAAAYGLAALAVAAVLGVKLALIPWVEHDTPFLLFFAAVLVAGWFGGLGPGLLATALSAFASAYFFMHPFLDIHVEHPVQRVRLLLFLAEAVFISGLASFLRRARSSAAAAAEEARDLEHRLLLASEQARRDVGHDLHDGLGQYLSGAAFRARLLVRRLESRGVAEAEDAKVVEELLSHSVAWARNLAAGLSPAGLRNDGLAAALGELAALTGRTFNVECTFHGEPSADGIVGDAALHLYHIAQESVGNAARHGKPTQIRIALSAAADRIVLTVEDDGTGIAERRDGGNGLHTMAYRARLLGGRLDVTRLLPRGTAVTCFVPRFA
jgi:signal transduction histidine kinase